MAKSRHLAWVNSDIEYDRPIAEELYRAEIPFSLLSNPEQAHSNLRFTKYPVILIGSSLGDYPGGLILPEPVPKNKKNSYFLKHAVKGPGSINHATPAIILTPSETEAWEIMEKNYSQVSVFSRENLDMERLVEQIRTYMEYAEMKPYKEKRPAHMELTI